MKTAIYIEDGVVQLVLTPESDFERNAMRSFEDKAIDAKIFAGAFYDCRGGWTRQTEANPNLIPANSGERSLIVRVSTVGGG